MPRIPNLRESTLDAEKHAGAIEQDARVEALAHQARGLKHVDEADGPLEGHGVEGHERLLTGLGFDVFEDLLLVIDEEIPFFCVRATRQQAWSAPYRGRLLCLTQAADQGGLSPGRPVKNVASVSRP